MQNKPANRWLDIQIVLVTLAMTVSLMLWNLFAGKNLPITSKADLRASQSSVPAQVQKTTIYFSNNAPQSQVVYAPSDPGPVSAPAPVTSTSSSRP